MKRAWWFHLDLEGIDFHFRILRYRKSTKENWDDEWCEVDLTLQARKWLDYHITSSELILSVEVEELRDNIDALLNDRIKEGDSLECIEPDFQFFFHSKEDLRLNPRILYVKPGYEISDVHMDFTINIWDQTGALSSNQLLLYFNRYNLERLLLFLRLVTGVVSEDDDLINKMISDGCLYG